MNHPSKTDLISKNSLSAKIDELLRTQIILESSLESAVNMIILSIDANYCYLYFNKIHENVMKLSYGVDVKLGMNILNCITVEIDRVNAKENYSKALNGISHSTIQEYGDIEKRYYETFYNSILDANGNIIGATAFARDITERKQMEENLIASEKRFSDLFEKAPLGYQSLDENGCFNEVNEAWTTTLGYSKDEVIGKWFGDFLVDGYVEGFRTRFPMFKQLGSIISEFEMKHKNGKLLTISFNGRIGYKNNGDFEKTHCILTDVTEERKIERQLKESEEKYRLLYSEMDQGVALHKIILDENGKPIDYIYVDINESYSKLFGVKKEMVIGKHIREVMPKVEEYWIQEFGKVALTGKSSYFENYLETTGKYYSTHTYSPKPYYFAVIVTDISEKNKHIEEITFLSYHDQLTGLYNRRFYEAELKRLDTERNLPLSIVMGDVNGLKLVNDSFGHSAGDELLVTVAKSMRSACRSDDIIARLGGDEFIIILPKTGPAESEKLIERIKLNLSKEMDLLVDVSVSFGYDTKYYVSENIQNVFKKTEDYMYRHKLYERSSMRSNTIDLIMKTLFEKNHREMMHSKRVSEICVSIGESLGLNSDAINQLRATGLLHDIGKIAIDEKILNCDRALSKEEWIEIEKHSEIGCRILSSAGEFSEIAEVVLQHHERWDGKGYPRGLKENQITLNARIVAVADTFDAMVSERAYRKAFNEEEAISEIVRCSGTQFDPKIVETFLKMTNDANKA